MNHEPHYQDLLTAQKHVDDGYTIYNYGGNVLVKTMKVNSYGNEGMKTAERFFMGVTPDVMYYFKKLTKDL